MHHAGVACDTRRVEDVGFPFDVDRVGVACEGMGCGGHGAELGGDEACDLSSVEREEVGAGAVDARLPEEFREADGARGRPHDVLVLQDVQVAVDDFKGVFGGRGGGCEAVFDGFAAVVGGAEAEPHFADVDEAVRGEDGENGKSDLFAVFVDVGHGVCSFPAELASVHLDELSIGGVHEELGEEAEGAFSVGLLHGVELENEVAEERAFGGAADDDAGVDFVDFERAAGDSDDDFGDGDGEISEFARDVAEAVVLVDAERGVAIVRASSGDAKGSEESAVALDVELFRGLDAFVLGGDRIRQERHDRRVGGFEIERRHAPEGFCLAVDPRLGAEGSPAVVGLASEAVGPRGRPFPIGDVAVQVEGLREHDASGGAGRAGGDEAVFADDARVDRNEEIRGLLVEGEGAVDVVEAVLFAFRGFFRGEGFVSAVVDVFDRGFDVDFPFETYGGERFFERALPVAGEVETDDAGDDEVLFVPHEPLELRRAGVDVAGPLEFDAVGDLELPRVGSGVDAAEGARVGEEAGDVVWKVEPDAEGDGDFLSSATAGAEAVGVAGALLRAALSFLEDAEAIGEELEVAVENVDAIGVVEDEGAVEEGDGDEVGDELAVFGGGLGVGGDDLSDRNELGGFDVFEGSRTLVEYIDHLSITPHGEGGELRDVVVIEVFVDFEPRVFHVASGGFEDGVLRRV